MLPSSYLIYDHRTTLSNTDDINIILTGDLHLEFNAKT